MSTQPTAVISRRNVVAQSSPDPITSVFRAVVAEGNERLIEVFAELLAERPPKKLLDADGIREVLGISTPVLRRLRAEGMPTVRVGDHFRYDSDRVIEWLSSRDEGSK